MRIATAAQRAVPVLMMLCVLEGGLLARSASAQLAANGKSLTVTTSNAVATFTGPDLVGFVNSLTGESYLTHPSDGRAGDGQHHDFVLRRCRHRTGRSGRSRSPAIRWRRRRVRIPDAR